MQEIATVRTIRLVTGLAMVLAQQKGLALRTAAFILGIGRVGKSTHIERTLVMKRLLPLILSSDLFADLSEGEATPVVHAGTVETYEVGHGLACEGDVSNELVLLLSGTVQAHSDDDPASTQHYSASSRPVVLAQAGLLQDVPRSSTIFTDSACSIFRLPRDSCETLLQAEHVGAYKVALAPGRNRSNPCLFTARRHPQPLRLLPGVSSGRGPGRLPQATSHRVESLN